ncbi:MAG: DinB family protein [Caldilineales bacterium]
MHEAQRERYELMAVLTDADLAYKLPGDNPTLGELCREIGEVEACYIESFKTFKLDWSDRTNEPGLATSVARLVAWYTALDQEFEAVVREFSEEDLHQKRIDRGYGFSPSLYVQFEIYRESLLMFYAKASVYLKALQKTVNNRWHAAIG